MRERAGSETISGPVSPTHVSPPRQLLVPTHLAPVDEKIESGISQLPVSKTSFYLLLYSGKD